MPSTAGILRSLQRQPTLERLDEHEGRASIRKHYEKNPVFRRLVARPSRHKRFKTV
jgi:hypothetical protein